MDSQNISSFLSVGFPGNFLESNKEGKKTETSPGKSKEQTLVKDEYRYAIIESRTTQGDTAELTRESRTESTINIHTNLGFGFGQIS